MRAHNMSARAHHECVRCACKAFQWLECVFLHKFYSMEDVLKCAICWESWGETCEGRMCSQCHAIFCCDCMQKVLSTQSPLCCPCCRHVFKDHEINKTPPIIHRITAALPAACRYGGCHWTGRRDELEAHYRFNCLAIKLQREEHLNAQLGAQLRNQGLPDLSRASCLSVQHMVQDVTGGMERMRLDASVPRNKRRRLTVY